MPIIVVTRLRLRDPALLDEFFAGAVSVLEQTKDSPGATGSDVLADANDVWWTVSGWQDRDSMRVFVRSEPHLSVMDRLDDWCDEATFVDWDQDSADLPGWQTSYEHLVADGGAATLTHATAANGTREFPPPVESS